MYKIFTEFFIEVINAREKKITLSKVIHRYHYWGGGGATGERGIPSPKLSLDCHPIW